MFLDKFCMNSGAMRVEGEGSGAKAPPLAACPDACPLPASYCGSLYPESFSTITRVRPLGHRSSPLDQTISSCPNYLHSDVRDGQDLSRHQQEVTGEQRVKMSFVPGTVDSDVSSECHLCCHPPVPTEELSSLYGS